MFKSQIQTDFQSTEYRREEKKMKKIREVENHGSDTMLEYYIYIYIYVCIQCLGEREEEKEKTLVLMTLVTKGEKKGIYRQKEKIKLSLIYIQ